MTEKSTDYAQPAGTESRRARILWALKLAREAELISDSVWASGATMASYISDDFQRPLCAVEVQRLARDRSRDASTIRRHVAALIEAGLAENHTAGNGLRGAFYGGEVVLGISFAPALERLDALHAEVLARREAINEKLGLQRELSQLRQRLRVMCEEARDSETLQWLLSLPRRYAGIGRDELVAFARACIERIEIIARSNVYPQATTDKPEESELGQAKMRDGPREIGRPYTDTTKHNSKISTARPRPMDALGTTDESAFEPLGSIPLERLVRAAPHAWREHLNDFANEPSLAGWRGFTLIAHSFFREAHGDEATWRRACARGGEKLVSILMLLANASGNIRDINRWMIAMVERALANRVNAATPLYLLGRKHGMRALQEA